MTSDPAPKRSDDETEAELVKRRLIDAVREQLGEIGASAGDEFAADDEISQRSSDGDDDPPRDAAGGVRASSPVSRPRPVVGEDLLRVFVARDSSPRARSAWAERRS